MFESSHIVAATVAVATTEDDEEMLNTDVSNI